MFVNNVFVIIYMVPIRVASAYYAFRYKFIAAAIIAIGIVTNEISLSRDRMQ